MYKTILVPVDLAHPELGEKTLKIARQVGGAEARIRLLHVLPEIPVFVAAEMPREILERTKKRADEALKAMGDEAGVETRVVPGHPPTAILEHAGEIGADLIVIASHRPGFQDYFLGSTASRVVRHAQCAVLVDR